MEVTMEPGKFTPYNGIPGFFLAYGVSFAIRINHHNTAQEYKP
jgi:hypothetical protein